MEALLPRKSKNKIISWLLPIAATLVIFFSLWLVTRPVNKSQYVNKSDIKPASAGDSTKAIDTGKSTQALGNQSSIKTTAQSFSSNRLEFSSLNAVNPSNKRNAFKPIKSFEPAVENSNSTLLIANSVKLQDKISSTNSGFYTREIKSIHLPADTLKDLKSEEVFKNHGRFSLALAVSPDINSVNQFSSSDFGTSLGFSASYKITQRLSATTGIGYSKKVYSADSYEYKAPWASSTAGKYAKSIDADCLVLDIPINFRYTISESPKQNLFASVGFSSYFMLKEKYTLIRNTQSGYPANNLKYLYTNENSHLLSIVNISVGMIKPLSKQTSIVIEPYVKMPYTGIGQGKVNLQSAGMSIQFQYNLSAKGKD